MDKQTIKLDTLIGRQLLAIAKIDYEFIADKTFFCGLMDAYVYIDSEKREITVSDEFIDY